MPCVRLPCPADAGPRLASTVVRFGAAGLGACCWVALAIRRERMSPRAMGGMGAAFFLLLGVLVPVSDVVLKVQRGIA